MSEGDLMMATILETLPVGFRFYPSDQLLVDHYLNLKIRGMDVQLKLKILGKDSQVDIIPEVDVCEWEPWELPAKLNHPVFSVLPTDEPEWLFFTLLQNKYRNGRQFKRDTRAGFWKPTGPDRKIKRRGTDDLIGSKKTLVFHRGRGPSAASTPWVIHEYHSVMASLSANKTYVLCRLKTEALSGFPPETNFNGRLPELPFIQAPSLMNMEVGNSSTGTGILQNGAANIMSLGDSSKIIFDNRSFQHNMTPQDYALSNGALLYNLSIDSDGFLYEEGST